MDFKIINAVVLVSLVFFLGCYTSGASAVNGTSNTGVQGTGGGGAQTNTSSSASGSTNQNAGGGTLTGTQTNTSSSASGGTNLNAGGGTLTGTQTNTSSSASGGTNQNAGGGTLTGTQTNTSSSASNNNGVQGSNTGGSAAQATSNCIEGTCIGQDCDKTLNKTCAFKGSCEKTVTTTGQITTITLGCGPSVCPASTTSPSTTAAAQASNTAAKTAPVFTCCEKAMCNKYQPPPKSAAFKLQINLSSLIGMAIVLSLLK